MPHATRSFGLLAVVLSVLCLSAQAEEIFGLTSTGSLVRFDASAPDVILSTTPITGVITGDALVGIDFRPATGELYALGIASRVYTINIATGAATQIGIATFNLPALTGTKFAFDFNPVADRLRVVSDTGVNQRLDPNTGANAAGGAPNNADFNVAYSVGDENAGLTPKVVGAAYSNNFPGTSVTTLYGIDSAQGTLVTQGGLNGLPTPNGNSLTVPAELFTIGSLGFAVTDDVGFDIAGGSGRAYASLVAQGETASKLYEINLTTGTAALLGAISTLTLVDISTVPPPFDYDMVVLNTNSSIFRFNTRNPSVTSIAPGAGTPVSIRGLTAGDSIRAIDFRPANGLMYGLGVNGTNARLYTIDPVTGIAATVDPAGTTTFTVGGTNFGFDFNPVADRARVVSNTGTSLRIHPDTGALFSTDTNLAFTPGDPNELVAVNCVASAYTNNIAGTTTTQLFNFQIGNTVNATNGVLVLQNPPNAGLLLTIGNLGVAPGGNTGFDITSNGNFGLMNNNLYRIDLTTGAATQVGITNIANGATALRDIAGVIDPSIARVQFSAATYSVVEGSTVVVTVTRTGNTSGTITVDYDASAGTATLGTDFVPVSGTLVFAHGESSRTFTVEGLTDITQELFESINLTLSNPVGVVLGAQTTATVDLIDFDDRDGDGFSTAEEVAAGTSDSSSSDTPFGGAPAGTIDTTNMVITKVSVKLNFTKTLSDAISFSGELRNVASPLTTDGKKFVVNFGGVTNSVIMTAKLSGTSTDKTFSVKLGKPKGTISKFSVKMSKGSFAALLADEGLADDPDSPTKAPRSVLIKALFDNKNYQTTRTLLVTIKTGKGSSASAPKK